MSGPTPWKINVEFLAGFSDIAGGLDARDGVAGDLSLVGNFIWGRTKKALAGPQERVTMTGQRGDTPGDQAPRLSDRHSASTGAGLQ